MELMDEGPPPFKKQKTELNEQAEVEEGDGAEDVADSEKVQDEEEATNKTPNQKAGLFITSDTKYTPASSTNLCVFTALAKTRDHSKQAYTKKSQKNYFAPGSRKCTPRKKYTPINSPGTTRISTESPRLSYPRSKNSSMFGWRCIEESL